MKLVVDLSSSFVGVLSVIPPDVTDPVLTLPTGVSPGQYTASGTVTTNESGGILYYLVSTNASENASVVKASSQQPLVAAGIQNVSISGLTVDTTYYIHYVHVDASGNESVVASTLSFVTEAGAGLIIASVSAVIPNNIFTISTSGTYDLTTAISITATLEGITLTGLTNITETSCDFMCPASGISLINPSDLILTINI
jgi:hypothetical protein